MRAKALARVRALPRKALTLLTWSVPSLLLFGVTTYVIVTNVLDVFHDNDSLKWTVIAAVLTGAALLVGLIGLPFAIYQLFSLDRDLTRPMKLGEELKAFRLTGSQLQFRLHHPDTDDQAARDTLADEFAQWVEDVATFIRTELDDEAEEHAFRFAGDKKSPKDQLDAKLLYIRNDIWPKVREAYW
jgi:hypothetical protein